MAGTRGKVLFKLFEPKTPPPGWKCPKWFKLGLEEPWESEGSDDSETDTDEVVLRKETTEMRMESTEGKNCNDETKHQRTKWNDETLLDETDTLLLLASQKFEAEYACNNHDVRLVKDPQVVRKTRLTTRCCCILRSNLKRE